MLISFLVVFASSMALANQVTIESKALPRCFNSASNVTAIVSADSVSAIEIVVVVDGNLTLPLPGSIFTFDAGFTALTDRVVDDTSGVDGVMPDTIRIAAMLLTPSAGALAQGNHVVGRINYRTNDVCSGSGTLQGGVFDYPIPATVTTQFVDAATSSILPVVVNNGTVTITNLSPTIAAIPNGTLFWGQTFVATASGTDPDMANGCETLTYAKVAGPAAMTVNPATGAISWLTTGADVCTHNVTISITDKCGAAAQTSFTICVQNNAPVITCPASPIMVVLGDPANGDVNATDADSGPKPLIYSVVSFNGPGTVTMNPATGVFSWPTVNDDISYLGSFTLVVMVTDSANTCSPCSPSNADTCSVTINVNWGKVVIEKIHNQIQGQYAEVDIVLGTNYPIGGFDLLIKYDNSALTLSEVLPGGFITDCGWEYFTYRFGANGNCAGGCPSGLVRIVSIAETNNGNNHPDCFTNYPPPPGIDSVIASLKFLVTNDRTLECQYTPVEFFWIDCGDNGLSSVDGDSLLISRYVYGYGGGDPYFHIEETAGIEFPTTQGAQEECDLFTPGKPSTWRVIDFFNGGVDIVCADSIDARGDINLNNFSNEIADAVLFSRYFIYGLPVFTINQAGQIAATDVNADGLTLTVADLVYLIRVVVGDEAPYDKVAAVSANYSFDNGALSIDGVDLGAAFVVVAGEVTPVLHADNVGMQYAFDGTNTRILVSPIMDETVTNITGFSGTFLTGLNGSIVSIEMATVLGQPVSGKIIPKNFGLAQNYPNPFNPATTIEFALPVASNYTLTVYNVTGQVVKTFEGTEEAGMHQVIWNANEASSGVYFYKLNAGTFSSTKKMVLLK
ncbi:MAG: T9SS type A sorting domain-containing protein [bacterium]|nr:T9SS type A sorting domain-containing protein [bacterium]